MQPDPWLTFWIAVGGALAALASGFGSIWALTQKRRYLPKPLIKVRTDREDDGVGLSPETAGYLHVFESLRFIGTNKGDGIAHDVRIVLHGPVGPKNPFGPKITFGWKQELQPGMSLSVALALTDLSAKEVEYNNVVLLTSDGADTALFWAELTWRQAPNMKRVRRLVIREKR